jgi:hypothetical protein
MIIKTPRFFYAGDKAKAESLKGAGMEWWDTVLKSNPDAASVSRKKRLPDGSLIIATVQSLGYEVKTGTIHIVATSSGGVIEISGFLYKERDDAGVLTGNVNWIVTDKNGFVELRKGVDFFTELESWSNHAPTKGVVLSQRYYEGKVIIPAISGEKILYSWASFGKLVYLSETNNLVTYSGNQRKKITFRILGSAQTIVIPYQTIGAIQLGASKDGTKFFIFAHMPDDTDLPDFTNMTAAEFTTNFETASSCVVRDKWRVLLEYTISKSGADYVLTNSLLKEEYQAWVFSEAEVSAVRSGYLEYGNFNPDFTPKYITLNAYYLDNALTTQTAQLSDFIYNFAAPDGFLYFSFDVNGKPCSITQYAEIGNASQTAAWNVWQFQPFQRYSDLQPARHITHEAITSPATGYELYRVQASLLSNPPYGVCDLASIPLGDKQYIYPMSRGFSLSTSTSWLLSNLASISRINAITYHENPFYSSNLLPKNDAISAIDSENLKVSQSAVYFSNKTSNPSFPQFVGFVFPRELFGRGEYGYGDSVDSTELETAFNAKHFTKLNNDFATILTDKFKNNLIVSYGADYQLGDYQNYSVVYPDYTLPLPDGTAGHVINNPTVTLKLVTQAAIDTSLTNNMPVTPVNVPTTQILKRDDILGVI